MREGNVLSRVCLLVCLFTGGPTIQDPGHTPSLHGPSTRFHFRRYRGTPLLSWSILFSFSCSFEKAKFEQECIPIGCVPAARRPYAGVCFPGGCLLRGGLLHEGVSVPRGVCSGGCLFWGCLFQGGSAGDTPPWTESQTPVKTLPWPNFVAAGKNQFGDPV